MVNISSKPVKADATNIDLNGVMGSIADALLDFAKKVKNTSNDSYGVSGDSIDANYIAQLESMGLTQYDVQRILSGEVTLEELLTEIESDVDTSRLLSILAAQYLQESGYEFNTLDELDAAIETAKAEYQQAMLDAQNLRQQMNLPGGVSGFYETPQAKAAQIKMQQLEALKDYITTQISTYITNSNYLNNEDFAENCQYKVDVTNFAQDFQTNSNMKNLMIMLADLINGGNSFTYSTDNTGMLHVWIDGVEYNFPNDMLDNYRSWVSVMSVEEKQIFNYILNTEGYEAAYNYLESISDSLDQNWNIKKAQEDAEWAAEHPVEASLTSIVVTPFEGMVSMINSTSAVLSGEKIRRVDNYSTGTVYRSAVSSMVGEKYGQGWQFAYDVGMSMADTAVVAVPTMLSGGTLSGYALGAFTFTNMGTRVYVSALNDALDRGLSDGQAVIEAWVYTAAETAMESISLGNLAKISARMNSRVLNAADKAIVNIADPKKAAWTARAITIFGSGASQALVEGEEEIATSIIDFFADNLIAADKSNFYLSIESYMNQGLSEDEAVAKAMQDTAYDWAMSFVGGAISGGIFGSGGAAYGIHTAGSSDRAAGIDVSSLASRIEGMIDNYNPNSNDRYIVQNISNILANNNAFGDDISVLVSNLIYIFEAKGLKLSIADSGARFMPSGPLLSNPEIAIDLSTWQSNNDMTFLHEVGHALYQLALGDATISPSTELTKAFEIARQNASANTEGIATLLKMVEQERNLQFKATEEWFDGIRESEKIKMESLVDSLYKQGNLTELAEMIKNAKYAFALPNIQQLLEQNGLLKTDIDAILSNQELTKAIIVSENAISLQESHMNELMLTSSESGAYRKMSSMLSSIMMTMQSVTNSLGEQVPYYYGHGDSYWARFDNPSAVALDELMADYFSVMASGKIEVIDRLRTIVGNEIFDALDNEYSKIVEKFKADGIDLSMPTQTILSIQNATKAVFNKFKSILGKQNLYFTPPYMQIYDKFLDKIELSIGKFKSFLSIIQTNIFKFTLNRNLSKLDDLFTSVSIDERTFDNVATKLLDKTGLQDAFKAVEDFGRVREGIPEGYTWMVLKELEAIEDVDAVFPYKDSYNEIFKQYSVEELKQLFMTYFVRIKSIENINILRDNSVLVNDLNSFFKSMKNTAESISNLFKQVVDEVNIVRNKTLDNINSFAGTVSGKFDSAINMFGELANKILDNINSFVGTVSGKFKSFLTKNDFEETTRLDYLNHLDSLKIDYYDDFVAGVTEVCERLGITEQELFSILDNKMTTIIKDVEIVTRVPVGIIYQILNEGRIKNAFETGTTQNFELNSSYRDDRMSAENKMFGIPDDLKLSDRPIYGAAYPSLREPGQFSYYFDNSATFYGDVAVIYDKEKIIANTTFTIGDSLNNVGDVIGSLAFEPKVNSFPYGFLTDTFKSLDDLINASFSSLFPAGKGYLEFQIHGASSHTLDNIKAIVFPTTPPQTIQTQLEQLGITLIDASKW